MLPWIDHALGTWILTRSAGLFAYLLLWLAAVTGLLQAGRLTGRALPGDLVMAVHRWAAAWALYAATVHVVILLYDPWEPFTLAGILLPFAARYRPGAVALGVYSLYAALGVQITSYLLGRIDTRLWRWTHRLSIPAYLLALAHGVVLGTDTRLPWAQALYALTAASFAGVLGLRLGRAAVPRRARGG
ncbi:MAG: ferric reductase-like transmembrane domain-containing protein [Firmicutes bacterium]|nr:ferric reductase-like transmembrane domain-containing protein [Bacillota bacterium]